MKVIKVRKFNQKILLKKRYGSINRSI